MSLEDATIGTDTLVLALAIVKLVGLLQQYAVIDG